MDYEKKYKDALEQAKKIKHDVQNIGCKMDADMLDLIFPELRESEDEKIRKEIIGYLESKISTAEETELLYFKRWIAWLEKPKEPKDPFDDEQFRKGYETGYEDAARVNFKRNERFEECLAKCDPEVRKEVSENIDKMLEQNPAESQNYSNLTDFERAIQRGFLCAGVENVPVTIIKETAQDCLAQIKPVEIKVDNPTIQKVDPDVKVTTSDSSASGKELLYVSNKSYDIGFRDGVASVKPAEWSEEDENIFINIIEKANDGKWIEFNEIGWLIERFKSLRPHWKPSDPNSLKKKAGPKARSI